MKAEMGLRNKPAKAAIRVLPSCKVYTPQNLAIGMARALGNQAGDRWLEPSVGTGALLSALSQAGVQRRQIVGLDLDPVMQPLDRLAQVNRPVEFLKWSLRTTERFDKIIANPPYLPLERLQKAVREAACRVQALGIFKVTAGANAWLAFLIASLGLLRPRGSLCFLLPAAWDFANYAAPLRKGIAHFFDEVTILRSRVPLFRADNIQDGSVVLIAKGLKAATASAEKTAPALIVRREYTTLNRLVRGLLTHSASSPKAQRPSRNASANADSPVIRRSADTLSLSKLLTVHLGGVTGDARYFLLTEAQRLALGLPVASLRPVVSRAKHLASSMLTMSRWEELKHSGERVWLFHPPPSLESHGAVSSYISRGLDLGGCATRNHKITIRSPWYRTRLPDRVDGFLSGMSRLGPWICLRQMNRLTATNTLYVVKFGVANGENDRASTALTMLTTRAADQFCAYARHYADGLVKYEPGDLGKIRVEPPPRRRGAVAHYDRAIRALLREDVALARSIADHWVQR